MKKCCSMKENYELLVELIKFAEKQWVEVVTLESLHSSNKNDIIDLLIDNQIEEATTYTKNGEVLIVTEIAPQFYVQCNVAPEYRHTMDSLKRVHKLNKIVTVYE